MRWKVLQQALPEGALLQLKKAALLSASAGIGIVSGAQLQLSANANLITAPAATPASAC